MQPNGSNVALEIDRLIDAERRVLLARNEEARGSEEAKGRTLRPLRFSDRRRQIPATHQQTEAACGRQNGERGGEFMSRNFSGT